MRLRVGIALALALLIAGITPVLASGGPSRTSSDDKIEARVLRDTAGGKTASIVINLADQANVSSAYQIADEDARGWFVYRTLKEHAAKTQAPLRALLASRGVSYRSYWVSNVIFARADRSRRRPGMAVAGSVLVQAFDRVGWGWGGRWAGSPDYQHFSSTGN